MSTLEFKVQQRAKTIFEQEHPNDRRWGTNTAKGQSAFRMEIREPGDPPPAVLSAEERKPYIDRALKELIAEGVIQAPAV